MIRYLPFLLLLFGLHAFADNATYIKGPALIESTTTTATAAGTTTLTVSSNTNQEFTGSTTQNVVLPNATTLANGRRFKIWNRSTGALTLKDNGANTLATVPAGVDLDALLISNGTSNGTWSIETVARPVAAGGTGSTTLTANNVILGNGTSAVQFVAPSTSGNVLTSNGTTWQSTAPAASSGKSTGELFMFAGTSCPANSVAADGTNALRTGGTECGGGSCANLYAAIGCAHGCADGTHFNFPDIRGKFVRGYSNGATNDPDKASRTACATGGNTGDAVGSCQADATQKNGLALSDPGHSHTTNAITSGGTWDFSGGASYGNTATVNSNTTGITLGGGDNETRPINVGVLYCIQY